MKKLLTVLLFCASVSYSQTSMGTQNEPARPVIGWDSLKSMIAYPELARRAGVQGYVNVAVEIDETGKVESVTVSGYGIFRSNVEEIVRKTQWYPEMSSGKPVKSSVVFEIQFQLKNIQDMPKKRLLIIESEVPSQHGKLR